MRAAPAIHPWARRHAPPTTLSPLWKEERLGLAQQKQTAAGVMRFVGSEPDAGLRRSPAFGRRTTC